MRALLAAALLAGPLAGPLAGRPAAAPVDPPKAADPAEVEVQFLDGSNVKVAVLDPTVEVVTRYGKLTVPFADVRKVEVGFRFPDGAEAKADKAAADLGAAAFRDREQAERDLLALREYAVPALRRAATGADPEAAGRAAGVLRKLAALLPDDRLRPNEYDLVDTPVATVIRVRTRQFGEAAVRVDQVRAIKAIPQEAGGKELTLDAAAHAKQGWVSWFDTGLDVAADGPLEVTCSGQIDQWPQQPGQYLSGPSGTQAVVPPPGGGAMPGVPAAQFRSGAVVGRVGPAGPPFVVGAGFKAQKAPGTGRLFLIIAPSSWGNDSSGGYQVKVRLGD